MIRYAYCAVHGPTDADDGGCLRCQERCRSAKTRRDGLIARKLCINGASHGRAVRNLRCEWCAAVHSIGLARVLASPSAPKRPKSKRRRVA